MEHLTEQDCLGAYRFLTTIADGIDSLAYSHDAFRNQRYGPALRDHFATESRQLRVLAMSAEKMSRGFKPLPK